MNDEHSHEPTATDLHDLGGDGSVNGVIMISAASGFSNCSAAPALNRSPVPAYLARANALSTSALTAWSHLQTEVSSAFDRLGRTVAPQPRSFVAASNPAERTPAANVAVTRRSVLRSLASSIREQTVSAMSVPLATIHEFSSGIRGASSASRASTPGC